MKVEKIRQRLDWIVGVGIIVISIAVAGYYVDLQISKIYSEPLEFYFPLEKIMLYVFLTNTLILLAPFLLMIVIIGIYVLMQKRSRVIVVPAPDNEPPPNYDVDFLSKNEMLVLETLFMSSGKVLQIDLTKKTGLRPYQITRIIDKFETFDWVERKNYGKTNILILKLRKPIQ